MPSAFEVIEGVKIGTLVSWGLSLLAIGLSIFL